MYSRLVLLLPGPINYKKFNNFFTESDYIIAVDGGIEHSTSLNVIPKLWVGDFDSCEKKSLEDFSMIPKEEFPTDKDYLDTELALLKAKELNLYTCAMVGGIGGRLDHQFGLFMMITSHPELAFLHTNGDTTLHSLNNKTQKEIQSHGFKYLSILPITPLVDVTISSVRWPLNNVDLSPGKGFSLSNQPVASIVHYSQQDGLGWLILTN